MDPENRWFVKENRLSGCHSTRVHVSLRECRGSLFCLPGLVEPGQVSMILDPIPDRTDGRKAHTPLNCACILSVSILQSSTFQGLGEVQKVAIAREQPQKALLKCLLRRQL